MIVYSNIMQDLLLNDYICARIVCKKKNDMI